MAKKKTTEPGILFLHVRPENKKWFKALTTRMKNSEQSIGRVTQSTVADRILRNLKRNPRLLADALKGRKEAA
jgi:hypothetical protein